MVAMATPSPVPDERAPMKPRAILWDLFGDHLRYIDGGLGGKGWVPMRARPSSSILMLRAVSA